MYSKPRKFSGENFRGHFSLGCISVYWKVFSQRPFPKISRLFNDLPYYNGNWSMCESYDALHPVASMVTLIWSSKLLLNAMLQMIYEERGLTLRQMTFSNARDMIEIRKLFKEPHYYEDLITMSLEQIHQKSPDDRLRPHRDRAGGGI